MEKYANLGGNSNVTAFDVGGRYIDVVFAGTSYYRYSYESAGVEKVEERKK